MITAKVYIPKNIFPDKRENKKVVDNALNETAAAIKIDYKVTHQTWTTDPAFQVEKPKWEERDIFTTNKIYLFVSRGTRVRYATMTPDFQAKTMPRIIASRGGAGGVAYISKARPRPGIKAREFEKVVSKKWVKEWPRNLQRAIAAAHG